MLTIFHNPRCSKSRETLALLQQHGAALHVVDYLQTPPSEQQLAALLQLLGCTARQLIRSKEPEYLQHALDNPDLSEQQLIRAMVQSPKLIERPIVFNTHQAAIGRPPANVLALLK